MWKTDVGQQTVSTGWQDGRWQTEVLPVPSGDTVYGEYDSEEEARSGHAALVGRLREFAAGGSSQT
jgi:hypothetical protein